MLVWLARNVISFIKEYRRPTLNLPCDVIDDVIIMKKTIFGMIWNDLFYIWGQIEAVFKNSKWPSFWARDKLLYRQLYRKLNIPEKIAISISNIVTNTDRQTHTNTQGENIITSLSRVINIWTQHWFRLWHSVIGIYLKSFVEKLFWLYFHQLFR